METFSVGFSQTIPGATASPPSPSPGSATTVTVGGKTITMADWIDDKLYETVSFGATERPRPGFGHLPGGRWHRRWPDVLHKAKVWGRHGPDAGAMLDRVREARIFFTEEDCLRITKQLHLNDEATEAVAIMITVTDFTDCDSEWALVNLIDAAVETASRG